MPAGRPSGYDRQRAVAGGRAPGPALQGMAVLKVERLGGPGFGGPHLKSRGSVAVDALSDADRQAIEALFRRGSRKVDPGAPGAFRYRLTRPGKTGPETIEVPEPLVPAAVVASVRDMIE